MALSATLILAPFRLTVKPRNLRFLGLSTALLLAFTEAVVVDSVEERLQVYVHHPAVSFTDSGLRVAHSLVGIAPWPKAVAVGVKVRLPLLLHHLGHSFLDEPIHHRGDAQQAFSSVWLGDFYALDGFGLVSACHQLGA